jgi:hypothetical protein
MDRALRALLEGLIDYAGLFPPARLAMEPAFRNYLAYRASDDWWMLGRFLCPVARLGELEPLLSEVPAHPPVPLSAIARPVESAIALAESLAEDAAALRALQDRNAGRIRTEALEVRLPEDAARPAAVTAIAAAAVAHLAGRRLTPAPVFLEAGWGPEWRERVGAAVLGIAAARAAGADAGLKLRCGGLEPSDYPSAGQLAFAVAACRRAGVPFKATAGLHHPLRHQDEGAGARMHGFLNLFGAAVLAQAGQMPEEAVAEMLEDGSAESFRFADGSFGWKEHEASAGEVEAARHELATSYGSCSFDEPRDDLRALGLL